MQRKRGNSKEEEGEKENTGDEEEEGEKENTGDEEWDCEGEWDREEEKGQAMKSTSFWHTLEKKQSSGKMKPAWLPRFRYARDNDDDICRQLKLDRLPPKFVAPETYEVEDILKEDKFQTEVSAIVSLRVALPNSIYVIPDTGSILRSGFERYVIDMINNGQSVAFCLNDGMYNVKNHP